MQFLCPLCGEVVSRDSFLHGELFCRASERDRFLKVLGDPLANYILAEFAALISGDKPPALYGNPKGIPAECHTSFMAAQLALGGPHIISTGTTLDGKASFGPARRFLGSRTAQDVEYPFAPFDYFADLYRSKSNKSRDTVRAIKKETKKLNARADRKHASVDALVTRFVDLATAKKPGG